MRKITVSILLLCFIVSNTLAAVRICEVDESRCDPKAAPFTCLEGPAINGCSPDESFWPDHGCAKFCKRQTQLRPADTSANKAPVSNTVIPLTVRDCNPGESYCNPTVVPFTCLEGPAKNGCTANPSFWPSNGCASQCKAKVPVQPAAQPVAQPKPQPQPPATNPTSQPTTQPATKPTPQPLPQTVRACKSGESYCGQNVPYTCLEGPAKNGCNPDPAFWPANGCANQCTVKTAAAPATNPPSNPPVNNPPANPPVNNPAPANPAPANPNPPAAGVRVCNAGESQCNAGSPFTCLEGPAKNGCSNAATFWPASGCPNQCEVKPQAAPSPSNPNLPSGNPNAPRTFNIFNRGKNHIWIAVLADPSQNKSISFADRGFLLNPGQNRTVVITPPFSGRVWARTGCQRVQRIGGGKPYFGAPKNQLEECKSANDDDCMLACDTGNCRAGNGMAGEFQCTVSGETPCSVIEFTLGGWGGADYYDLSNVDGYSTGMGIKVVSGEPVVGVPPEFNCGNPACLINDKVESWCPPELRVHSGSGVYCTSICKALEEGHINQVDDKVVHTVKLPKGEWKGTARQYLRYLGSTDDFMDNLGRAGKMRDRLCCQCGAGGGGCESLNSRCTYGCSPYVTNYGSQYDNRKCPARIDNGVLSDSPDWPPSTQGTNYADIFKEKCLYAYSWQFNDNSSTYLCKNANYELSFN